jgi:hypothetical protein
MRGLRILTGCLLLLAGIAGCAAIPEETSEAERPDMVSIYRQRILAQTILDPGEPVPMDFRSYAFFLFPDPNWYHRGARPILRALFREFQKFGDAVGEDNLAVWFFNSKSDPDVDRSRTFAKIFDLDPQGGPYIVYVEPRFRTPIHMLVLEKGGLLEKVVTFEGLKQVGEKPAVDRFVVDLSEIDPADAPLLLEILAGMLRDRETVDFERLRAAREEIRFSILVARMGRTSENLLKIAEHIEAECRRRGLDVEFRREPVSSGEG